MIYKQMRGPYVSKLYRSPIARRRILMGLTQYEVEKALGVSHMTYSKWETGKSMPNAENLLKIAKLFGCRIEDLYGGEYGNTEPVPADAAGSGGAVPDQR